VSTRSLQKCVNFKEFKRKNGGISFSFCIDRGPLKMSEEK
jgi:hypothetical protein